jgi:hypothetical protein
MIEKVDQLWPQANMWNYWLNVQSLDSISNKMALHLKERIESPKRAEKMHVTQAILTPNGQLIAQGFVPFNRVKSLKKLAETINPQLLQWLENEWSKMELNIIIMDHVQPQFVELVKRLNEQYAAKRRESLVSHSVQ